MSSRSLGDEARRIAHERPLEVLERLAGISGEYLDGSHHACPWRCDPGAGGKDRFRLIDRNVGAVYCQQCFKNKNGDCIDAVEKHNRTDFAGACKLIVSTFGSADPPATPRTVPESVESNDEADPGSMELRELDFKHAKIFADKKGGIVPDALRLVGAKLTTHSGIVSIAIPFCGQSLDLSQPVAWKKFHILGVPYEWKKGGKEFKAKSLSTRGPSGDWAGEVARLKAECFGNDKPTSPRVIIHTEGEPDLLALLSHRAALPADWICLTNQCGQEDFSPEKPWMFGAFKGHHYVAIADNDEDGGGLDAAKLRAARALEAGCATAKALELTWRGDEPKKKDLRDWKMAGHAPAELIKAVGDAEKLTKKLAKEYIKEFGKKKSKPASKKKESSGPARQTGLDLPKVLNGFDTHRIVDEFISVIARSAKVQRRGRDLCEIRGALPGHEVSVELIDDEHRLADLLSGMLRFGDAKEGNGSESGGPTLSAVLQQTGLQDASETPDKDFTDKEIPRKILRAVLKRKEFPGVPALIDVSDIPVFMRDGTLVTENGWDSRGVFIHSNTKFPSVKDSPSRDDAVAAKNELLDIICDFRFADYDAACRAAWLATLMTPFARPSFDGPCPMIAVDAPIKGSGKGMLVDTILILATGNRDFPRTSWGKNEEENRKLLTSLVVRGRRFVMFDNNNYIGGNSLESILTAGSWEDRLLGTNSVASSPARTIFLATGNQMEFSSDMIRRVLHIRIDPKVERPGERSDFKHADLVTFVAENRARFVNAVLTILRAYFVAGRPSFQLPTWASFVGWSSIIRNAVVWLGMTDPYELQRRMSDTADDWAADLRQVIAAWEAVDPDRKGMTVGDCLDKLNAIYGNTHLANLFDLLLPKDKIRNPRSIGWRLSKFKDQISEGLTFKVRVENNQNKFFVQDANQTGFFAENGVLEIKTPLETPPLKSSPGNALASSEGVLGVLSSNATHMENQEFYLDGSNTRAYKGGQITPLKAPKPREVDSGGCPTCGTALDEVAAEMGWRHVECLKCGKIVRKIAPPSKSVMNGAEVAHA